jgi:hypothetical protein
MTVWDFANSSPGASVLMVLILAYAATRPFAYAFRAYNRRLRSRNIAAHGWPTPPIDADGDVVYPEKADGN